MQRIPPKFVRDFGHELSEDATLAVPNGRPWRVRLKRDEGGVWFDDGWYDFAKYYSVSAGYISIFKYGKNSNFRVLIFDFTACEINYKREEGSKLDKRSRQSAANYSFENFKAKHKYRECEPQIKKCRKEELVEKNESDDGGGGGGGDIEYNLWDLLTEMGICISKKHRAFSTVESKRVLKIARSLNLKYPTSLIILQSSSITHNRVVSSLNKHC